jgi:hypothetical protein
MEKYYVSTLLWVKFCENFPPIQEIIHWMCERAGKQGLEDHLYKKFCEYYDDATAHGVMTKFYCELDSELRNALVEYALTVWSPKGMYSTFEANKELLGL